MQLERVQLESVDRWNFRYHPAFSALNLNGSLFCLFLTARPFPEPKQTNAFVKQLWSWASRLESVGEYCLTLLQP